jgi:hypothetical protein
MISNLSIISRLNTSFRIIYLLKKIIVVLIAIFQDYFKLGYASLNNITLVANFSLIQEKID